MFCGARSYISIPIKGLLDLGLACMDSRIWGLCPLFLVVGFTAWLLFKILIFRKAFRFYEIEKTRLCKGLLDLSLGSFRF